MNDDYPQLDITGIDRAELLAELHNGTRAIGMGVLHDLHRPMTREEAAEIVRKREGNTEFDYVCGRPIKVWFLGNVLDRPDLYDRDAPGGPGSCARIVDRLKSKAKG